MPALISLEDRVKLRDEVSAPRASACCARSPTHWKFSPEIPVVMVLEDLHWSDPSTIDLLAWIARRTSPARLMMLATYRGSDAGGVSSPLLVAQNELKLHRQCQVIPLDYFSESETGEYVNTRFGGADTPELAAALHRRTNGNPLYVVCLVDELERAGKIAGDPESVHHMVPETLQQMFERQSGQLDSRVQEMLEMAAVDGESFSVAAAAAALNRDAAEVEAQCGNRPAQRDPEIRRAFPVPGRQRIPGYSSLHALCRDALYQKVPAGRRSRLHGMLARAEERLYASDPKRIAAELAGHFEMSGDIAHAIRFCAWPRTAPIPASPRKKPCGIWSAHSPWSNGCVRTIGPDAHGPARTARTAANVLLGPARCGCGYQEWVQEPARPAPGSRKPGAARKRPRLDDP